MAKSIGWLPAGLTLGDAWDGRKAKVGDYAEVVRMVHNLAHPARYVLDHNKGRVTKKWLERQFQITLACRDWLEEKNDIELRRAMKDEGLL